MKIKFFIYFVILVSISNYAISKNIVKENSDNSKSPYFLIKSGDSTIESFPLLETSAEVNIMGVIADVTIHQVYKNNGKKTIEAVYVFPASTRAAVYGMRMIIGDRILEAEIQKKEEARKTYDNAIKEGKTASLLEQERPNMFQMTVGNILPGDTISVELKYTELLIPENGVYEFVYPTVVGPRYVSNSEKNPTDATNMPYQHENEKPSYKFNININLQSGIPVDSLRSTTHSITYNYASPSNVKIALDKSEKFGGNRDFILQYKLQGNKIQTGLLLSENNKEKNFLLMLQPPKRVNAEDIPPREYIFIIDVSGSMHGFPLDVSKVMMEKLLNNLTPNDKFNVLLFSGSSSFLHKEPLPVNKKNIQEALDLLKRQTGAGGTELLPALKKAYSIPKVDGYSKTIILITDGFVNVEAEAIDLVKNNLNKANVFAFGIGSSVNRYLMEGLARAGMGMPFVIQRADDAQEYADKFKEYIESPLMTDIKVKFDGFTAYDVEPTELPDLFAERPIILYGKYTGDATGNIIVSGLAGKTELKTVVDVQKFGTVEQSPALKYLWARQRIASLSDYNTITGREQTKDDITDLGLKYNLLTNYTSFVAVDYKVRTNGEKIEKVKQPLPMPEGVSDYAVGSDKMVNSGYMSKSLRANSNGYNIRGSREEESSPLMPKESSKTEKSNSDTIPYYKIIRKSKPYKGQPDRHISYDTNELNSNVEYPDIAKKMGCEGKVTVLAFIDTLGIVRSMDIKKTDNEFLNEFAKLAIYKTKFTPELVDGELVDKWITITIEFKMDEASRNMKRNWVTLESGIKYLDVFVGFGEEAKDSARVTYYSRKYYGNGILYENKILKRIPDIVNINQSKFLNEISFAFLGLKPGTKRIIIIPNNLVKIIAEKNVKIPTNTTMIYEIEASKIENRILTK